MLESLPITLIIGLLLGFLAGIGVGGGSLLMLWLTMLVHMQQTDARAINLMFFIAAAASVSVFRWKRGNLELKALIPAITGGCICAGIFSWISGHLDLEILRKIFGILLLVTGFRELFYRARNAK